MSRPPRSARPRSEAERSSAGSARWTSIRSRSTCPARGHISVISEEDTFSEFWRDYIRGLTHAGPAHLPPVWVLAPHTSSEFRHSAITVPIQPASVSSNPTCASHCQSMRSVQGGVDFLRPIRQVSPCRQVAETRNGDATPDNNKEAAATLLRDRRPLQSPKAELFASSQP